MYVLRACIDTCLVCIDTYQSVLIRILHVLLAYLVCMGTFQYLIHANTYLNTCINTCPIRRGGIGMYSIHTSTYWHVFWHVFCLYQACDVRIPTHTGCSNGHKYVNQYGLRYLPIRSTLHANTDHYMPIHPRVHAQYMPDRAVTVTAVRTAACG